MTLISLSTSKISAFRIAFEAIESLVTDVVFVFSVDGIRIRDIDKTGNLLVSAKFEGSMFDEFLFDHTSDEYKIGIAVDTMVKSIKSNLTYDHLTFEVRDEVGKQPTITITMRSTVRDEDKVCTIKRADVISSDDNIFDMSFYAKCVINPTILSKYIKDLNHICEYVSIGVIDGAMTMDGIVDDNTIVSYVIKNGNSVLVEKIDDEDHKKKMSIKRLMLLNKCVNLYPTMSLYLSNTLPLIAVYPMSSLGELKMVYM